jgi:uncharacterized sulfatase
MIRNTSLYFSVFCCSITTIFAQAQETRPNIIFIYSDDQGAWTLGVSGNPDAHTPNLDRLAREGAYQINSFATTPVCSPARTSIMTNRYASEYGILDFIAQPKHKLYNPRSVTFAEVLKSSGYTTGLIEKWHLGDWAESADKKYHPTNHGFDYFMGITDGGTSPDNPPLEKDGIVREFKGLTTDILTDDAISFVEKNQNEPFLLSLNYRAPHGKWLPVSPEDWEPYENMDPAIPNPNYPDLDTEKVKQRMQEYLASTTGIDRNVGKLLNRLDELNLSENTVIIFSSDHGYNMSHNGIEHQGNGVWITKNPPQSTENIPARQRPNLYDNPLKVPAMVRWPSKIKTGTIINQVISSLDWYPTIVAMARVNLPQEYVVCGKSLMPLLEGKSTANWDNDFYAEYSMIHYAQAYMRSYRTRGWKLVKDFLDPNRDELYHISLDSEENINMIYDSRAEVKEMITFLSKKITEQIRAINDPLLTQVKSE